MGIAIAGTTSTDESVEAGLPTAYTRQDVDKARIIVRWLEQHDKSRAWLSKRTQIPSGTLSQVLNCKYASSPTAQLDQALAVIEVESQRLAEGTPGYVKGSMHALINVVCDRARKARSINVITAHVGTGKTRTLKEYTASHPQTLLIESAPKLKPGTLMIDLLRQLGLPEPYGIDRKFATIVNHIRDTNYLLILDEADKASPNALEHLRRIRDLAGVGVVLSGTEQLRTMLGQAHGQFDQIRSRVGMWPPTIKAIKRDDADDMARAALGEAGELSDEVLDTLWAYCRGSARVLMEGLVPAIRDYGLKRGPLTAALIEAVASKVLFYERPGGLAPATAPAPAVSMGPPATVTPLSTKQQG